MTIGSAISALCLSAAVLSLSRQSLHAEEPLPNLDINRAALATAKGVMGMNQAEVELQEKRGGAIPPNTLAIIKGGLEPLFNQNVPIETHCRDYVVSHWREYSEYAQLMSIKNIASRSDEGYCVLLLDLDFNSGNPDAGPEHLMSLERDNRPSSQTTPWPAPPNTAEVRRAGLACQQFDSVSAMTRRIGDQAATTHVSCDNGRSTGWLINVGGVWKLN